MGFPAANQQMAGVGKGSTAGTHRFGRGGMGNPPERKEGDGGEDEQSGVVAAAWHGKDQGARETSTGTGHG